jgi:hypothetical protein
MNSYGDGDDEESYMLCCLWFQMCATLAASWRSSKLTSQVHSYSCAYCPASNRRRFVFIENRQITKLSRVCTCSLMDMRGQIHDIIWSFTLLPLLPLNSTCRLLEEGLA